MNTVLLIITIVCLTMQTVFKKIYNNRSVADCKYFFSMLLSLGATAFFVFTSRGLRFSVEVLPYSLMFAVFYGLASVGSFLSIANGPLSITALIISYSLMVPTLYGIIFLNEVPGIGLCVGIVLLILSLFLISKKSRNAPMTLKWVIYVALAFIGNGMCSVVQKMQQNAFDGKFKNEFMIIALVVISLFMGILTLAKERDKLTGNVKYGLICGLSCGFMNGIVNMLVMVLSGSMAISIMFPLISSGDVVLTYLISTFVYKEKLTIKQFVGFLFGVASVIFLNL